jgi:hypothetical protein
MTQAAVSVLLIVTAGLFVRATFRAAALDVGFDPDGLYVVDGVPNISTRGLPEIGAVPGVMSATLVELPPFSGLTRSAASGDAQARIVTYFNRTRAEYFDTMGMRVIAGRTFSRDEVAAKSPVALISESVARKFWPDRSPLGELLAAQIPIPEVPPSPRPVVIGIVADAITARLHEASTFAVYQPLDPASEASGRLMLRVVPGTTGALQQVSERLRTIDPMAVIRIRSIADDLRQEANQPRMLAALTGVVGAIAIVLCVIGLYGLTASVVGQRGRELGVRVALGARRSDLLRLMMWDGLRPVIAGLVIGAGAAFLAGRVVVAAMFFGTSPQDPVALAGATATLLAAAVLAVLVPTRRAASVDAAIVLRS